jgi:hypothetical protein
MVATVASVWTGTYVFAGFTKEFGVYNPTTGKYALPAYLSSLMTSLPFLGKALVRTVFLASPMDLLF